MIKGLKRIVGETPRASRRGVAPQQLRIAMDLLLNRFDPAHTNIRAALSVALQALLRSAEYTSKEGKLREVSTITRGRLDMTLQDYPHEVAPAPARAPRLRMIDQKQKF